MKESKDFTLLLAEDEALLRDIYETKLRMEGYNLLVATNGREVLELVKETKPDLFILDVMMPYVDGLEALAEIKKDDALKDVPVVMLTNVAEREQLNEAERLGVTNYVIKAHFTPSEVVKKVRTILGQDENGHAA